MIVRALLRAVLGGRSITLLPTALDVLRTGIIYLGALGVGRVRVS